MSCSFKYFSLQTILITIFILSYSVHPYITKAVKNPAPFKKIYAFGDSYTDTGNTDSATGPVFFTSVSSPPYGCTFFHHPTNRYSDGRLVIDFVAETLSLPYLLPYLNKKLDGKSNGVNFAVAGSTAIEHKFYTRNNITLNTIPQSLQTQLYWFGKLLENEGCINLTTTPIHCNAVFDEALIWVGEIGLNDYEYALASSVAAKTIQQLAIKRATNFLQTLLNKGAKYVVVQGLPTTGCLTLSMYLSVENTTNRDDIGCIGSANKQSYTHNTIYQAKLEYLRTQFPNAIIVYADFWNAYRTVMKNPGKYGFKELYKACCGSSGGQYNFDLFGTCGSPASSSCTNPSQYINWDGAHLTEAMYKAISDLYLNGSFTSPPFEYLLNKKK